jgi:hypothetical protein
MHWGIAKIKRKHGYVNYYAINQKIKSKKKKVTLLHRFLMSEPEGMVVDHRDRDTFNNRKYNLRICTQEGNVRNQSLSLANKSGHKGVFWDDHMFTPKWKAYIQYKRKTIHLGYFENYKDACKCREEAELKYFGKYSTLYDEE